MALNDKVIYKVRHPSQNSPFWSENNFRSSIASFVEGQEFPSNSSHATSIGRGKESAKNENIKTMTFESTSSQFSLLLSVAALYPKAIKP